MQGRELLLSTLPKQDRGSGRIERRSHRFACPLAVHTSVPPAQVFTNQQAVPGHSRCPQFGSLALHPTWKPAGDIKSAAEPSLHPVGEITHRHPWAATSWGGAEGWSQHLPGQCHGQSLHQQLSFHHPDIALAEGFTAQILLCLVSCLSFSFIPACSTLTPGFTSCTSTCLWGPAKSWPSPGEPHH